MVVEQASFSQWLQAGGTCLLSGLGISLPRSGIPQMEPLKTTVATKVSSTGGNK